MGDQKMPTVKPGCEFRITAKADGVIGCRPPQQSNTTHNRVKMEKIEILVDGEKTINMHIIKAITQSYGFYNELWVDVAFQTPKTVKTLVIKMRDNAPFVDFIIESLKEISDYEMNEVYG